MINQPNVNNNEHNEQDSNVRYVQKAYKCQQCYFHFKKLTPIDENHTKCTNCQEGMAIIDIPNEFSRESLNKAFGMTYKSNKDSKDRSTKATTNSSTTLNKKSNVEVRRRVLEPYSNQNGGQIASINGHHDNHAINYNSSRNIITVTNNVPFNNNSTSSNNTRNTRNTERQTNNGQSNQSNQNSNTNNFNNPPPITFNFNFFMPFENTNTNNNHTYNDHTYNDTFNHSNNHTFNHTNNHSNNPFNNLFFTQNRNSEIESIFSQFFTNFNQDSNQFFFGGQNMNMNANMDMNMNNQKSIDDIIKALYKIKLDETYATKKEKLEFEYPTCSVCLVETAKDDNGVLLPCGHIYHNNCIEKWLKSHNTHKNCPVCRFELSLDNLKKFSNEQIIKRNKNIEMNKGNNLKNMDSMDIDSEYEIKDNYNHHNHNNHNNYNDDIIIEDCRRDQNN